MQTSRRSSWIWKLVAALAVLLLIWLGFIAWHGYGLYRAYQSAKSLSDEVQNGKMPIDEAGQTVGAARSNLHAIRGALTPVLPVCSLLGGAPAQLSPLLDYGENALTAADLLVQAVQPAWAALQDSQGQSVPALVKALNDHQEQVKDAEAAIDQAVQARQRLNLQLLPGALSTQLAKADAYLPLAQAGIALLEQVPYLAGAGQERTYLIAAQNSDELRATGGFLTSVGLLRVKDGQIISMSLSDSYQVDDLNADYPDPPQALQDYMLAGMWVLRDANWSPDFPSSAREIEALYKLSIGGSVDGVLVFDQQSVKMLLHVLGAVQLEGSNTVIDENNVFDWMHDSWAPPPGKEMTGVYWSYRKAFMSILAKEMIRRMMTMKSTQQLKAVALLAIEILKQGHMLMYFNRFEAQDALADLGFDGGVEPGQGDYLFLVDSNVGFNKVDGLIKRSLAYQVDLTKPADPHASLTVTYVHPSTVSDVACTQVVLYGKAYKDMMDRCYLDYWRVLTPPGSNFSHSDAPSIPADIFLSKVAWNGTITQSVAEGNTIQFAGVALVPTHATRSFTVAWQLPRAVIWQDGTAVRYHLKLQKQPGISGFPFRLEIRPPAGMKLAQPPAGWVASEETGAWSWQGNIDRTTVFDLVFEP